MNSKLYSVQYLRGIAAVIVVMAHAYVHPFAAANYDFAQLGRIGVVLFFVLSGFIMVFISGTGPFAPGEFLKRRIIRIVPLYWFFTTAAALLAIATPSLFKTTVFTWPHYIMSLLFIAHEAPVRGGVTPILTLGWTLNFEAYFYVCFAALAFLSARRRVVVMSLTFMAFHLAGVVLRPQNPVLQFYSDYSPLAFCAGAWIGLAALDGRIHTGGRWVTPIAVATAAVGLIGTFVLERHVSGSHFAFASVVIFSCAVLLLSLRHESRMPRHGFLEKIGDSSYAIYLVHMFVVGAVVAIGYRFMPIDNISANVVVVCIATALSVAGGVVVHEWLEKPIYRRLKLGRREITAIEGQVNVKLSA